MKPPNIDHLIKRLKRLDRQQLEQVEAFLTRLESAGCGHRASRSGRDWPHAPVHRLQGAGTYIVTAGTMGKEHLFREHEMLDLVETELLQKATEYKWQLEAWAVFSNHYHFVGHALEDAKSLKPYLSHLHADTARAVNKRQKQEGRQVWYNFWETELTYETSYLARLNYVHRNPVKHGLVDNANKYPWCSAAWFERTATPAQMQTIYSFKTDKLSVYDDF